MEIADRFLCQYSKEEGKPFTGFSNEVIDVFNSYKWPGNVGELQTIIRNAIILGSGPINLIHSALANFVSEEAQSRRKYEYFQGFATHSETKFAVPFGFSEEGPSGKK